MDAKVQLKKKLPVMSTSLQVLPTELDFGKISVEESSVLRINLRNADPVPIRFQVKIHPSRSTREATLSPHFTTGSLGGGLSRHIDIEVIGVHMGHLQDTVVQIHTENFVYSLPVRCEIIARKIKRQ